MPRGGEGSSAEVGLGAGVEAVLHPHPHRAVHWDAATGQPQLTLTDHTSPVTGGAWSPDGTRLLTTSDDGTARIWDAVTGQPVGWQLGQLPDGELAVWSSPEHELLGASDGAWRWLGWLVPQDGRLVRLPAETWGPLPPLTSPAAAPL